jgi:hypothetical protein
MSKDREKKESTPLDDKKYADSLNNTGGTTQQKTTQKSIQTDETQSTR